MYIGEGMKNTFLETFCALWRRANQNDISYNKMSSKDNSKLRKLCHLHNYLLHVTFPIIGPGTPCWNSSCICWLHRGTWSMILDQQCYPETLCEYRLRSSLNCMCVSRWGWGEEYTAGECGGMAGLLLMDCSLRLLPLCFLNPPLSFNEKVHEYLTYSGAKKVFSQPPIVQILPLKKMRGL